jgi:hypothetical protein
MAMSNIRDHIKKEKYYDIVVDGHGDERPTFSHATIETDDGTYVLGDKCPKCGAAIVPSITKINGEYHTKPYCPVCKG